MAKNTRRGRRSGAVKGRTQVKNPRSGKWTKRNSYTGQFMSSKKDGGSFKGVTREK